MEIDERPECECCGFQGAKLITVSVESYKRREEGKTEQEVCVLCYSTWALNSHEYPRQYPYQSAVLRSLSVIGNMIMARLDEMEGKE